MGKAIRTVVIESPYAGGRGHTVEDNQEYLTLCIRECAFRGDSPYASHRMLTMALDDHSPVERARGIELGLAWRRKAGARIFYTDNGWSRGMNAARDLYAAEGLSFEFRLLGAGKPYSLYKGRGCRMPEACDP